MEVAWTEGEKERGCSAEVSVVEQQEGGVGVGEEVVVPEAPVNAPRMVAVGARAERGRWVAVGAELGEAGEEAVLAAEASMCRTTSTPHAPPAPLSHTLSTRSSRLLACPTQSTRSARQSTLMQSCSCTRPHSSPC